ncbi:MHC class II transactivator [Betta splendens]|uniref:MHC class II transactivator n=1 Tax=Betta splendens TaxID=158456 RepID=A0A6P7N7M3_BETSP|nr:MHC class II transactivator [Betta splendens]
MWKKQTQPFLPAASLQIDLDVREVKLLQTTMVQFEEVLGCVRLALTWAAPAQIRALLEGLVEQEIISEAYSRSLALHRLAEGICIDREPPCSPGTQDHSLENLESVFLLDESWTYGCQLTDGYNQDEGWEAVIDEDYLSIRSTPSVCETQSSRDDEMPEVLRSADPMQKPASDSERAEEGISAAEREWLEQVEEAARRVAVPLWQHWDRGRTMLLPMLPSALAERQTSQRSPAGEQCCLLKMEEETGLAAACRSLGFYTDNFRGVNADACSSLDAAETTRTPEDLCLCPDGGAALPGLDADPFSAFGGAGSPSPVEDGVKTSPNGLADEPEDPLPTAEELMSWSTEDGFTQVAELLSPSALRDTFTIATESLCSATTHHSVTSGFTETIENVFPSVFGTTRSSADALPASPDGTEHEEKLESHWGAKMQEEDQDTLLPTEYGDLPDDISEFMNDKYLLETDRLFEDFFNYDLDILSDLCLSDLSSLNHQQREDNKPARNTNKRRKRQRAAPSNQGSDDITPPKPKRQRPGRSNPKEARTQHVVTHNTEAGPDLSPVKTPELPTPPPRIIHVSPPIQFIIPDTAGWISPQLIRLPFPRSASAPTYILVPASPPPCKPQVPPLSPVDGAVAPVHMSSSPQGSATASKAISPPPLSPNNEISPCKESPQSPSVLDLPQATKDYIQDSKAHVGRTCMDMEEGLSLAAHYVDRHVSQKEALRSGKNTIKCLDKELVIMGETDRQRSLIGQSQIFDGFNGDKPKRYIFLFGNAGMGKSTLIRKLCLDWSNDCLPQFDFVFLLDGKALTLTEAAHSLQTLLLNLSTFAAPCADADAVFAQILAAPKRVLVIFDGFDELRDYEILLQNQEKDVMSSLQKDSRAPTFTVRQLYAAVLQRVLLPGCTLLLSSRPKGTASQILRRADSFLEVCGFTPADVETYLSRYFTDAALRASASGCLKDCSFLRLLCWNPGLCRLVCFVLEHSKGPEDLPRTLTGLCHQVLRLKIELDCRSTASPAGGQTQEPEQSAEETKSQISTKAPKRSRAQLHTRSRTQKARRTKKQKDSEEAEGETEAPGSELDRKEEKELLVQLSSLAWEGVKANSSVLPKDRTVSDQLRAFGIRMGLLLCRRLGAKTAVLNGEKEEKKELGGKKALTASTGSTGARDEHILLWANPFLQSYLAAARLSLSRSVSERSFLQTLPFQAGPKGRRRPQREEHELTQRFAAGVLFHKKAELQRLHSYAEGVKDTLVNKQALVRKHLQSLSHGDLSPAQVLEACHYVYEASFTHGGDSGDTSRLLSDLAAKLPEAQTFSGVPLNPPDVFAVQKVLERGGSEGRRFCLDLENSGVHVSGLRALVGLSNISTYRACIADVISLWEQLEQSGDDALLQGAFSKFKIHPLKATQVCHVEHLAKLVTIHRQRRLPNSSGQSHPILAEGVPAVEELHRLEYELDPDKGPLGLPKLWELLPGLQNLQHLDLENGNIGDKGAEQLADALASHSSLEILNLSQNSIGDHGVKKLASTLKDLPKLHCLSLYSNVISDQGAESLAAVLPHMSSLTVLDVLYNKLTDVGAQVLAACLKNCKKIKHLRMWNQFIPYGVLERLHKQDSRILCEAT